MKQVYPTRELAHIWAHNGQPSGRNPRGNVFFDNGTIYSYGTHFPMARHVSYRGKACVFMSASSYSNTTAKHKSHVRRAIPSGVPVFYVNPTLSPRDALREYQASVKQSRAALVTGTKPQRAKAWRAFQYVANDSYEFAKFFGYSVRFTLPPNNSAELANNAREWESACDARREAKRARHATEWREKQAARERELAEFARDSVALCARWRAGENCISNVSYRLPTMLRIVGENVETSAGASFPLDHAKRAARLLGHFLASGESYQRNGQSVHLGHYTIDSISSDGTLRAGCHVIQRDELVSFLQALEARELTECI
jgi:hypothetical protein